MARKIRYLTHPQVAIDPQTPVPEWSLSPQGAARVLALLESDALHGTTRVISSDETKALETAGPLSAGIDVFVTIRRAMHENDRSATGFLPPEEFEKTADAFFGKPDESICGWETANAAQARIVTAVKDVLAEDTNGDILIIGHGAVGTLLYCALAGFAIDRKYDQGPGGGGNYFTFEDPDHTPLHHWKPMEDLFR